MNGKNTIFDSNIIIYLSKRELDLSVIDQKIADLTVGIRKKKQIKLPDAIIAATAISKGACLVTRNVDDFKLTEAHMLNPFSD